METKKVTYHCLECRSYLDVEMEGDRHILEDGSHHGDLDPDANCDGHAMLIREGSMSMWMNAYQHFPNAQYGGPEEGGWYYTIWMPVAMVQVEGRHAVDHRGFLRPIVSQKHIEIAMSFGKMMDDIHGLGKVSISLELEAGEEGPVTKPTYR